MLSANLDVFFRSPKDGNRRVLHPGKILTASGNSYTAVLCTDKLDPEAGQELLLYFGTSNKFFQQPIRVDAISGSPQQIVVGFQTTGDRVSANERQCFRISTVIHDLTAKVGIHANCALNDVSANGFSITSNAKYLVGTQLPVTITHEGQTYSGTASVQSVRELQPGKYRYGMFCVTDKKTPETLSRGLSTITGSIQRAQLRRVAGA